MFLEVLSECASAHALKPSFWRDSDRAFLIRTGLIGLFQYSETVNELRAVARDEMLKKSIMRKFYNCLPRIGNRYYCSVYSTKK